MRSFILSLLLVSALFSFAQSLQVGEKLSFAVHSGEENYDFTVKMQQFSPEITFDYVLTTSPAICGAWPTAAFDS